MRLNVLFLLTCLAGAAAAQVPDSTRRDPGAVVSGTVYDSLGGRPLPGAIVQLVPAAATTRFIGNATADSLGRFELADVPEGQYMLGFFHPMLDSLFLEPTLKRVNVEGRRAVRADLSIPSPARFRTAICGAAKQPELAAVLVGVVRNARTLAPVGAAKVTGQWLEMSFTSQGVVNHIAHLDATTGDNGWFAMCNVPRDGTMLLTAVQGADTTDRIEVRVPGEGFARRELYLAVTPPGAVAEQPPAPVTAADSARPRRARGPTGPISGTVVAAAGGMPLSGAQVSVVGGPNTLTNERGEWTIGAAPLGTRMLEVRAVGYYPERRRVDIIGGARPIAVSLATLKSVLDTIKVTATRTKSLDLEGFESRKVSGMGRYLDEKEVARRQPLVTSDLFRSMTGIKYVGARGGMGTSLRMSGMFTETCVPAVYLNGHLMSGLAAIPDDTPDFDVDDLDLWIKPSEIAGIEVYTRGNVPPQFQPGLGGCGSIVIWSK